VETWATLLTSIGFIVFVAGIALVIIGIILAAVRRGSQERQRDEKEKKQSDKRVRGAGVVVIGPIPIVFGTDRGALLIALGAAIVLMILYLLVLSNS
jgi:uncharacterized protein (TIGR00304 family)